MQVYILNTKYEIIGIIDEFESLLWNEKYNDLGECEIYIPCNEDYLSLLRRGNYIYRSDDDMFCKIENIKIETDVENGDYIIAKGADITSILAGRIVRWQIVFSGTVGQFIQKVLTDNVISPEQSQRAIPYFEFDSSNIAEFSEKIEVSAFTDDLLQLILTTCKTYTIGFRVSFNMETHKLVFRLYRGKNKGYVEFSPDFANILSSSYSEDESAYKNIVYVGYKGLDERINLLSLYKGSEEPQGEERREFYVDGTGTSRDITLAELRTMFSEYTLTRYPVTNNEGIVTSVLYLIVDGEESTIIATSEGEGEDEKITVTDYTYLIFIRRIGENALAERVKVQSFEGIVDTIDTYEYKIDYSLGDIIKVKNEYGIEAEARITEIMESDDAEDGYSVEPKFEYLS